MKSRRRFWAPVGALEYHSSFTKLLENDIWDDIRNQRRLINIKLISNKCISII